MNTIRLILVFAASAVASFATINLADNMPGSRHAAKVPVFTGNPFVNSSQEVEKVASKQEEVSVSKLFEGKLSQTVITGLFWDPNPARRSVLLNGYILHVGDSFPTELWSRGNSFVLRSIDPGRITFSIPGGSDELVVKTFDLLPVRPKRATSSP